MRCNWGGGKGVCAPFLEIQKNILVKREKIKPSQIVVYSWHIFCSLNQEKTLLKQEKMLEFWMNFLLHRLSEKKWGPHAPSEIFPTYAHVRQASINFSDVREITTCRILVPNEIMRPGLRTQGECLSTSHLQKKSELI